MTSRLLRTGSAGLLLTTVLLATHAQAAVVWTSSFEKGDTSEWMLGTNPVGPDKVRKNFEAVSDQVYRGKFAGKITVHPDDLYGQYKQDRVDTQHQSTLTDEGENNWISGHYFMPEDAKVRNEIAFYETLKTSTNIMDFWVEPKAGGGTTLSFGTGFLGEKKLWTADFTKGVWHQIAIHVLWSQNAQTGTIDVWFDGQQVITAAHTKTKPDGNALFYQTGLHRKDPQPFDDTIYFDELIEADTMAEAKIAAPSADPGGGGGAGGMAAVGGGGGSGGSVAGAGGSSSGGSSGSGGGGAPTSAAGASAGGGASGGASAVAGAGAANGGTGGTGYMDDGLAEPADGCSCAVPGSRRGSWGAVLLGLVGLAALTRIRRRQS